MSSTASGAWRLKRVQVPTALTDNGANVTTAIKIAATDVNISFLRLMTMFLWIAAR
jgi:hypothetical protein